MAEALGVTASIIAIVQITQQIVALAKRNIHTTDHAHSVLSNLLGRLTAYKGLFEGLQVQAESHESSAIRLSALDHVGGPLTACKDALLFIRSALEKPRGRLWIGKVLNKDITNTLEKLDQLRPILQIALKADQKILLEAIEDYAKNISNDLQRLQSTTEDLHESVKLSLNDQETWRSNTRAAKAAKEETGKGVRQKMVLDWFSTLLGQNSRHQILIEARHGGTLEWSIKSLDFKEWLACKHKHLWLYGTAGSGKSVYSAFLIEHLQQVCTRNPTARKAMGFYYFDSNDDQDQIINRLLSSLIVQLSYCLTNLPKVVEELYDNHSSDGRRPCNLVRQNLLVRTLAALCDIHSSIFLVLDAIDELAENDIYSLFDVLQQLSDLAGARLQIFCASRPYLLIREEVDRLGWKTTSLKVEEIDKDISKYVTDCVGSKRAFSRLEAELKESLCSKILQSTQGMFLMAKLQLDRLEKVIRKVRRAKDILPILESWPQEIFGMYEKMLCDVPETSQDELRRALLLVCFARMPVTLLEAAEFSAIKSSNSMSSFHERFESPDALLRLSGGLFVNSNTRLYLSHYSVQEYLVSDHIKAGPARFFAIDKEEAAEEIFHTSLVYLKTLGCNDPGSLEAATSLLTTVLTQSDIRKLNDDYPLANLASIQWIAASPNLRDRYKDDMEVVLRSRQCLSHGFWWILQQPGTPVSFPNRRAARNSSTVTTVERLRLALQIAASLLQFHSSTWMSSMWISSDIYWDTPSFGGLSSPTRLNSTMVLNQAPTLKYSLHDIPLALGIILLELATGKTIFDSLGTPTEETLRDVISTDLPPIVSESYRDIVLRCLSGRFVGAVPGRPISLVSDDSLRHGIYQNVVRPLEDLLDFYDTPYRNMNLLAFFEASENITSGIQLIQEAYQQLDTRGE